jgi:hypothetical protein
MHVGSGVVEARAGMDCIEVRMTLRATQYGLTDFGTHPSVQHGPG